MSDISDTQKSQDTKDSADSKTTEEVGRGSTVSKETTPKPQSVDTSREKTQFGSSTGIAGQKAPSTHGTGTLRDKTQSTHNTGVADKGRWSTQRIAVYALFSALAIVTSYFSFPIIPGYNFLTFEPSGIVCLIAGFAFGPSAAAIVSVICWIPHIFTSMSGFWGAFIALIVSLAMSVPSAVIYQHKHTRKGALIAIVASWLLGIITALATNLIIDPFLYGWPIQKVLAIIPIALLPFNIVKFTVDGVVTFLIYKPISNLLNR